MLRISLGIATMGVMLFVAGILLHYVVGWLFGVEEAVFFLVAFVAAPLVFAAGVLGSIAAVVKHFLFRRR